METELDSLRLLCVSRGNEVDRLRKVIKDYKDQEPVAYQRRELDFAKWEQWRETDKAEFDRLTKLLKEHPHFSDRVQVRALVVAP